MRTRVKICGFTRVDDAIYASQCGVDAIGLVFYPPSPRHVSIEQAQAIVQALPAFVSVVALFVNEQEARIRQVLQAVSIDCLQFHGEESPDACGLYGKPYLKAIRMQADTNVAALAAAYSDAAGLLLDAYHPNVQGGTGEAFNWDLIPKQCDLPIILAGGLTADNAQQAIATVQPYALDVSSGVESEKGRKDPSKITAFMRQVHEGDRVEHDRKI
jgi:phosphoribosylanthranilate isomerase